MKKLLISGNKKLSTGILIFNLPPGKSCLNCSDCFKTCYARKAYRQYPSVKTVWDQNLETSKNNPVLFEKLITNQLERTGKDVIRIHSSGDFYNQEYIDLWAKIIRSFPKKRFYAYTKVKNILDFTGIEQLSNFNLIDSFINGHINFGSRDEVDTWIREDKTLFICPATKGKNVTCGKECNYCLTNNRVIFIKH